MSESPLTPNTLSSHFGTVAFYYRPGDGPLTVCVHGIGSSKAIFSGIFVNDYFKNRPILAVDMLGHGGSEAARGVTFSIEEHAAAISQVIQSILTPAQSVRLACHSVGGAVGVLLARGLGERVEAFVSIEGNLIGSDCGLITRRTISVSLETFLSRLRGELAVEIAAQGEDTTDFLATSGEVFYTTARSVVSLCDSGQLLSIFKDELRCRRAYIYGDRNSDMEILRRLGDVAAFGVSKSGHCMMLDNPEEFYEKLWKALS
jgi:pimeloyl-ACP methyl ester carboxylesterase